MFSSKRSNSNSKNKKGKKDEEVINSKTTKG